MNPAAIDLYSAGVHARRSRWLFELALGPQTDVGVMASLPNDLRGRPLVAFERRRQGGARRSGQHDLDRCCFWPPAPGSHQERWAVPRPRRSSAAGHAGPAGGLPLISAIAVPISADTSLMLRRHDHRVVLLRELREGLDRLLGHLELHRLLAARRRIASAILRIASAVASATATIAAASPCALLISACFSPSERAMKASRSPVAMLICSCGGLRRRRSARASRARR